MPAVCQVVFADVQITIRQRVAVLLVLDISQSFAPIIGLHKTDAASDWLLIKRLGKKGLPGVQVQK